VQWQCHGKLGPDFVQISYSIIISYQRVRQSIELEKNLFRVLYVLLVMLPLSVYSSLKYWVLGRNGATHTYQAFIVITESSWHCFTFQLETSFCLLRKKCYHHSRHSNTLSLSKYHTPLLFHTTELGSQLYLMKTLFMCVVHFACYTLTIYVFIFQNMEYLAEMEQHTHIPTYHCQHRVIMAMFHFPT